MQQQQQRQQCGHSAGDSGLVSLTVTRLLIATQAA